MSRALALVLDPQIDIRESISVLYGVLYSGGRAGREAGFAFLLAHFDELAARMRSDDASYFFAVPGVLCEPAARASAEAFFAPRAARYPGAEYTLRNALAEADQCIAEHARLEPEIEAFLGKY